MRRSPPATPVPPSNLEPPPPPVHPEPPPEEESVIVSTTEIQRWMNSIEGLATEIAHITGEGKMNSEQKGKVNTLLRRIVNASGQMCVLYQSAKQRVIAAQTTIQTLQEQQHFTEALENLKIAVTEKKSTVAEKTSFADMVKKGPENFVRPNNLSSIAIYPKELKTSDETKALVQKVICPEELKLQVRSLRKTRNGGVIISTETKEDIQKLRESSALSNSGLKVEEPYKRKPRIVIVGVPSDYSEKDLLKHICDQNLAEKLTSISKEDILAAMKLSHKSGKKDSPRCNFILEVSAEIRRALITQERVFLNWNSCPVRDFTIVTRCYKCQQYGHSSKFCKEPIPACGQCGELGHESKVCLKTAEPSKCATCLRFNKPAQHKTGDDSCPAKQFAINKYINSIDYAGA